MINAINFGSVAPRMATEMPGICGCSDASPAGATFSETLKKSIDEVSRLQEDASQAVTDLATGKNRKRDRRDDRDGKGRPGVQDAAGDPVKTDGRV